MEINNNQQLSKTSTEIQTSMIKILIADDHKLIRAGLKLTLSDCPDMEIICEASDGLEALEFAKKNKLDTVILDISMPGMNGLDVSAELKKSYPSLPILILSVLSEEAYASKSLKAGASGFVHKEKIPEELAIAIRKVANGGIYLSPAMKEKIESDPKSNYRRFLYENLSLTEFQVMAALASGKSIEMISKQLLLDTDNINTINISVLDKLELKDNSKLFSYCCEEGLI
jgi:DNA-binding NarL/FixJ family response regulator